MIASEWSPGVTDMRNSFNGLVARVQSVLNDDQFSWHLFISGGGTAI